MIISSQIHPFRESLQKMPQVNCGVFYTICVLFLAAPIKDTVNKKHMLSSRNRANTKPIQEDMSLFTIPSLLHKCALNLKVQVLDPYQLINFESLLFLLVDISKLLTVVVRNRLRTNDPKTHEILTSSRPQCLSSSIWGMVLDAMNIFIENKKLKPDCM